MMVMPKKNKLSAVSSALFGVLVVLSCCVWVASADEATQRYTSMEEVTLWVNKVGPYHNPQETYSYYSLPFCRPKMDKELRHKHDGLGAVLEGNDLRDSGIHIRFKSDMPFTQLCEISFDAAAVSAFTHAVQNHYWYQMYIDELPVWGMVGQMMVPDSNSNSDNDNNNNNNNNDGGAGGAEQAFIFTHKAFSISFNDDRIIEVNLTSENPRPIVVGATHPMTFSVVWKPTDTAFENRFDRYLDFSFFEHQIHWFSIFNSFMMVVFLCGLVVLVLMRTLKNDYIKYSTDDDDLELDRVIDESGWKLVHGDVFRAPPNLMLFSAIIGTGYQLFVLVFCVIVLCIVGSLYMGRGAILSTFLVLYALTSFLAGYSGGSYYKRNGGRQWKGAMMLTAALFPGLCFLVASVLNFIAVGYQSLASISFTTMLTMVGIWAIVAVPLVVFGTVVGRNMATKEQRRVNTIKRPIPAGKWFTKPLVLAAVSGVLPFGSIFIEMYFVFTSFWNYKFYYVYGFMLLVYCILIIVTMCVTIVSTYFLLNAENYHWQWTSFMSGASTAVYVYMYAIYYFFTKTNMYGFFQVSFYFGYMFMFCFGLFLLCGSIAFMGSNMFVRKIYQYIKSD